MKNGICFRENQTINFLLALILVLVAIQAHGQTKNLANTGTLTVIVNNFKNSAGHASLNLFNDGQAFPKELDKALRKVYITIINNKAVAVFENLDQGEYAVSVYHDENNDKVMNTNFLGIPKEGVGASNNAKGRFGPPKYKNAKFYFNGNSQTINISIIYL